MEIDDLENLQNILLELLNKGIFCGRGMANRLLWLSINFLQDGFGFYGAKTKRMCFIIGELNQKPLFHYELSFHTCISVCFFPGFLNVKKVLK